MRRSCHAPVATPGHRFSACDRVLRHQSELDGPALGGKSCRRIPGLCRGRHADGRGRREKEARAKMNRTARTVRSRGRPSWSERGISLPEILVVVALFGILALIGGMPFLASLKRQRLGAASANLQGFCQRALTEIQRRNVVVFLPLDAPAAKGSKAVQH